MIAEILCVGTELLLGNVVNTNATFLSQELSALGIDVFHHTVVGDNPARLEAALDIALGRADMVITTGGLGPTYDDLTKETVAQKLGLEMELHEDILEALIQNYKKFGPHFPKNNESQAYFPKGATIIPNNWGTAPSCAVEAMGKTVIMLPGPPREMKPIFKKYVIPFLTKDNQEVLVSRYCRIIGIGESAIEEQLESLLKESKNPSVAPYAANGETMLRVTAKAGSYEEGYAMTEPVVAQIRETLETAMYTVDKENLETVLVDMLAERGMKIAVCESCTGGTVASRITGVTGASKVFECGLVTYSNKIKQQVANVPVEVLMRYTAISKETATSMAEHVRQISGADIGIGVTGVAGPTDTEEANAGTIYIAVSGAHGTETLDLQSRRANDRAYNIAIASSRALNMAREYLLKHTEA